MNLKKDQTTVQKDRALFNHIAKNYERMDVHESLIIARKLRLKQTIAKANLGNNIDVLEIGCGAGFTAVYLEGSFKKFTGINYSDNQEELSNAQLFALIKTAGLKNIKTFPHGFFSMPFAKVVLHTQSIFKYLSKLTLSIGRGIGKYFSKLFWNHIIIGQKELL